MAQNPDLSNESFSTKMLYKTIRSRFPNVQQLSTDTLDEWLTKSEEDKETVLLVDIREKDEQSISSIKNSIQITPIDGTEHVLEVMEKKKVTNVVAFCSMGYRSCEFIQKLYRELRDRDRVNDISLYNLEGGLFKWANEDRFIVDATGNATNFVHPYSVVWGKFLNQEKKKYPANKL